ncbi:MAG: M14 family zinc carboxypeptidase [Gaiellaceae bacterium]
MLRSLILLAVLALAGGSDGDRRFENTVHGHTVLLPAGWQAWSKPGDAMTSAASYRVRNLGRIDEVPPHGHTRLWLLSYGRSACPSGAARAGEPIVLGELSSFEGMREGYNVSFCRGGHIFQALVKVGAGASAARLDEVVSVLESVRLTARAHAIGNTHSVRVLGRSHLDRPIRAWRIGNPTSPRRLLVVGCVHGNECAGMAVTQRLVNLARPVALDLWVIQNLNPDGLARGTRGNAWGVDLNRDFGSFSQPESRFARDLIRRIRPDVTIWFHQPQAVVRAWGPSRAEARRYARLARVPYRSLAWPPGTASRWQNGIGQTSFVVELPTGELSGERAVRYATAVLELGDPLCCGS